MIDFYKKIPEYYNNESRDFQIFTRVFDLVENSLKFDIDSINTILDTDSINNSYLDSAAKKVGFFESENYPDHILRFIISAFPYIIKYKGSLEGITRAAQAFLKINGIKDKPLIEIDNDKYLIKIGIQSTIFDISLLKVILKYILPTGYFLDIYFYSGAQLEPQAFPFVHTKDWYKLSDDTLKQASSIRSEDIVAKETDNISQGRNNTFDAVGMIYTYNDSEEDPNNDNK